MERKRPTHAIFFGSPMWTRAFLLGRSIGEIARVGSTLERPIDSLKTSSCWLGKWLHKYGVNDSRLIFWSCTHNHSRRNPALFEGCVRGSYQKIVWSQSRAGKWGPTTATQHARRRKEQEIHGRLIDLGRWIDLGHKANKTERHLRPQRQ
jgi:hypothetical protein